MLLEHQANQNEIPLFKRWFSDEKMELCIWYDEKANVKIFELSYDRHKQERLIRWTSRDGLSLRTVDQGENSPFKNSSPVHTPVDAPVESSIYQDFIERAQKLPKEVLKQSLFILGLSSTRPSTRATKRWLAVQRMKFLRDNRKSRPALKSRDFVDYLILFIQAVGTLPLLVVSIFMILLLTMETNKISDAKIPRESNKNQITVAAGEVFLLNSDAGSCVGRIVPTNNNSNTRNYETFYTTNMRANSTSWSEAQKFVGRVYTSPSPPELKINCGGFIVWWAGSGKINLGLRHNTMRNFKFSTTTETNLNAVDFNDPKLNWTYVESEETT